MAIYVVLVFVDSDYQAFNSPAGEAATDRVNNSPDLQPYYDILILYDWHEPESDHFRWVATAPIAEILTWAEEILANEESGE
jgi:hypothetical protein